MTAASKYVVDAYGLLEPDTGYSGPIVKYTANLIGYLNPEYFEFVNAYDNPVSTLYYTM
jgi:hypothetical protein